MNDRTLPATISASVPALAMNEQELIGVLQNSLYPGASLPSIKMAIGYCKAAGYDPMQKPVHIVPMWDSKAGQMRDVIMPGVGLYRTQAARTGQFAGMTEPEFGPDVTETIGGVSVTYPEWCRVTAKRQLESGTIAEFTAREFWKENYAVKGGKEKSVAPNAMWSRRIKGQLAKCTQAQALRLAFPEATGSGPTADEMEGKPLADAAEIIDGAATVIEQPQSKSAQAEQPAKSAEPGAAEPPAAAGNIGDQGKDEKTDDKPMQAGQKRILAAKLKNASLNDVDLKAVFGRALDEDGWLFTDFGKVQKFITERSGGQ